MTQTMQNKYLKSEKSLATCNIFDFKLQALQDIDSGKPKTSGRRKIKMADMSVNKLKRSDNYKNVLPNMSLA
jgi:hypothetical protein